MTDKDYNEIAAAISKSCDDPRESLPVMRIAIDVAYYFDVTYENFDRALFFHKARVTED